MTEVQIKVQLPDQVESMELLGAVIDAKGKEIKQQLFEQQPRISLVQSAKEPSSKVINCAN